MERTTVLDKNKCCPKEPLLNSLAGPLPVIKPKEIREDEPEDITEVWIKKEYKFPLNEMEEVSSDASDSLNNSLVFSCEMCDVTFTSTVYLENHERFCKGTKKPTVKVKPEEITTDIQTLAKLVDGKKRYFCELCDYHTYNTSCIKSHLVTHTGEKPFQCEVCGKKFTQASAITAHRRIHTQEKPYRCTECSYASKCASSLKKHTIVHTGERVFACKQCNYKTARSCSLTRHMINHTGAKPFSCNQCEYKTTEKRNLMDHIQGKHTDGKPLSCAHCEYKTAVKNNLTKHMRRMHSDQST